MLFPVHLFGSSYCKRKYKTSHINDLIEKVRRVTDFSQLEIKFVLIKHVLQSLLVHLIASLGLLKGVIYRLEKLFASLFWNSSENSNHFH